MVTDIVRVRKINPGLDGITNEMEVIVEIISSRATVRDILAIMAYASGS